jgi:hypothetical protein
MSAAAYIVAEHYVAERDVCDALAEAVARWVTMCNDDGIASPWFAGQALEAYHAHREANP